MPWSEVRKPSVSRDTNGVVTAQRFFKVDGFAPIQIVLDPTQITSVYNGSQDPLPDYDDDFPGVSGLSLVRWDTEGESENVWNAVAIYSTEPLSTLPAPNLSYAWQGSFQTETVEIPYAFIVDALLPGVPTVGDPNPPEPRQLLSWSTSTRRVIETRVRHSRQVRIQTDLANAIAIIERENNKLQKVGARWYRFEAGDYTQISSTVVLFNYSFISDSGTFKIKQPNAHAVDPSRLVTPKRRLTDPEMWGDQGIQIAQDADAPDNQPYFWARPPFHEIVIYPSAQNYTFEHGAIPPRPWIDSMRPFDLSAPAGQPQIPAQGWRDLPGIGNP